MTWTRQIGLCLAGTLAATTLLTAPATAQTGPPAGSRLTDLVNPFIGTQNEGNTYPGAAVPFGMVQLSPDTGHNTGYDYAQDHIRGFSLVHLSGVGCGLGGDLPVLPTTGDVTTTDYARYAAKFSHDDESASPGYYRVGLDSGIEAELTATARTGVQRYTFPATTKANVLVNAAQSLHGKVATKVEILDDHTVRTTLTGRGFCQDTVPYTLYTITHFDRPFTAHGTWTGSTVTDGAKTGADGAYVRFDTTEDRTVEATTALSYVDARGAALNLGAEGGRSFDAVHAAARRAWEDRLDDVRVQGGDDTLRRTFYSSL
ncbi:glycoside hydrolase family 92 protein, partial [Streptomyces sp. SID4985]|uniref:glycoside hydrolase domain-containing protein n=3 Tax=unclassified Streptomyces TaxID=2593676 RepID=UPI00137FB3C9